MTFQILEPVLLVEQIKNMIYKHTEHFNYLVGSNISTLTSICIHAKKNKYKMKWFQ